MEGVSVVGGIVNRGWIRKGEFMHGAEQGVTFHCSGSWEQADSRGLVVLGFGGTGLGVEGLIVLECFGVLRQWPAVLFKAEFGL
jgi:hypothetical protein